MKQRISKRAFYLTGGFMNARLFRLTRNRRWSYWQIP